MIIRNIISELNNKFSDFDDILGIGQTGDLLTILVPGKSDIDIFVLCEKIPSEDLREKVYHKHIKDIKQLSMSCINGGYWGIADGFQIEGIDVMYMFFEYNDMKEYIINVLNGEFLDKDGDFYPTGRISSIKNINIIFEKNNVYSNLKKLIDDCNPKIFKKLFDYHINKVIDEEDLGRVLLRRDTFFFHNVLDNALDHYFQAIYAVNQRFFPSRKRNIEHLKTFSIKPKNIVEDLEEILLLSVSQDKLKRSVELLYQIHQSTKDLIRE